MTRTGPILVVDNFDSFTHNVADALAVTGADVRVRRADALDMGAVAALGPALIVISPGPGHPDDAALPLAILRAFAGRVPVFGVCLGMQCLAVAFGGRVGRGEPVHGKSDAVTHDGTGLFRGLPSPLPVGRYHSLRVDRVPEGFTVQARTADGVPMALRHRAWPLAGVQFHPDSFLTPHGPEMLRRVARGDF